MSNMIAPMMFGHGRGRGHNLNRSTHQADAFGTDDFDRYADGQVRCKAVIDFLCGKRREPDLCPAEYSEAMAAIAARRGA